MNLVPNVRVGLLLSGTRTQSYCVERDTSSKSVWSLVSPADFPPPTQSDVPIAGLSRAYRFLHTFFPAGAPFG